MELNRLNDMPLKRIDIDWKSRSGVLELGGIEPSQIIMNGIRSLNFTRFDPWGPSGDIVDSEYYAEHPLGHWLMMRVQSGDYFEIIAENIRREPR